MVLLVGLMCALGASAQSALIATLMHGDEISTFQSSEALKQAYEKAVDGDVITLSSGTFNAPSKIAKAITIRGAGMMAYNTNPTKISGSTSFGSIQEESKLRIESVDFLSTVYFYNKVGICYFGNVKFSQYSYIDMDGLECKITMFQCDIAGISTTKSSKIQSMISFINSNVNLYYSSSTATSGGSLLLGASYENCDVLIRGEYGDLNMGQFKNCIIRSFQTYRLSSKCTATGCVYVGEATNFFANCAPELNKSFPKDTPIFKEGTQTYELTEENQKNWIGTDGTQVGMHGGNLPFDPAVDAPVISKFNVASKTTADGKLSVDIEVKAAE